MADAETYAPKQDDLVVLLGKREQTGRVIEIIPSGTYMRLRGKVYAPRRYTIVFEDGRRLTTVGCHLRPATQAECLAYCQACGEAYQQDMFKD